MGKKNPSYLSVTSWSTTSVKETKFLGGIFPNSKKHSRKSTGISYLWKLLSLFMHCQKKPHCKILAVFSPTLKLSIYWRNTKSELKLLANRVDERKQNWTFLFLAVPLQKCTVSLWHSSLSCILLLFFLWCTKTSSSNCDCSRWFLTNHRKDNRLNQCILPVVFPQFYKPGEADKSISSVLLAHLQMHDYFIAKVQM